MTTSATFKSIPVVMLVTMKQQARIMLLLVSLACCCSSALLAQDVYGSADGEMEERAPNAGLRRSAHVTRKPSLPGLSDQCPPNWMPLPVRNRFYGTAENMKYLHEVLDPHMMERRRGNANLKPEFTDPFSQSVASALISQPLMYDKALDHLHAYANLMLCDRYYANKAFAKPHAKGMSTNVVHAYDRNDFTQVTALLEEEGPADGHKTHICCSVLVHSVKATWGPQQKFAYCYYPACYQPKKVTSSLHANSFDYACDIPPIMGDILKHNGVGVSTQCLKLIVEDAFGK